MIDIINIYERHIKEFMDTGEDDCLRMALSYGENFKVDIFDSIKPDLLEKVIEGIEKYIENLEKDMQMEFPEETEIHMFPELKDTLEEIKEFMSNDLEKS